MLPESCAGAGFSLAKGEGRGPAAPRRASALCPSCPAARHGAAGAEIRVPFSYVGLAGEHPGDSWLMINRQEAWQGRTRRTESLREPGLVLERGACGAACRVWYGRAAAGPVTLPRPCTFHPVRPWDQGRKGRAGILPDSGPLPSAARSREERRRVSHQLCSPLRRTPRTWTTMR